MRAREVLLRDEVQVVISTAQRKVHGFDADSYFICSIYGEQDSSTRGPITYPPTFSTRVGSKVTCLRGHSTWRMAALTDDTPTVT